MGSSPLQSLEEYIILKFGLRYGLAARPNESIILVHAEDIWEQLDKSNNCRNEIYSKSKIKNVLRVLAFNPLSASFCPHIETSQLICTGNQLTGFCMRAKLALKGLIWSILRTAGYLKIQRKLKVLQQLCENVANLKPDKVIKVMSPFFLIIKVMLTLLKNCLD